MNLSDKIAEKTASLIANKDALVAAQKNFEEKPDDEGTFDALEKAIEVVEVS